MSTPRGRRRQGVGEKGLMFEPRLGKGCVRELKSNSAMMGKANESTNVAAKGTSLLI